MTDTRPAQKYQSSYSLNPTNFDDSQSTSASSNLYQPGVSISINTNPSKFTPQVNIYQQRALDNTTPKNQSNAAGIPSQKLTITTIDASQSVNPYERKEPTQISVSKASNPENETNPYKTPTNASLGKPFSFPKQGEVTERQFNPYQSYQSPSHDHVLQSIKKDERNLDGTKQTDSFVHKTRGNPPDTNRSYVPYKSREISSKEFDPYFSNIFHRITVDQSQPVSVVVSNTITPKNFERGQIQNQLQNIVNADKRNNIDSLVSKPQNPYPLTDKSAATLEYSKSDASLGVLFTRQREKAGITDSTDFTAGKQQALNPNTDRGRYNPMNSSVLTADYLSPLKTSSEVRALHLIRSNEKMERMKSIPQLALDKQYAEVRQRTLSPSHIRLPDRSTIRSSARGTVLARDLGAHHSPDASRLHQSVHSLAPQTTRGRVKPNWIEDSYSKLERSSILQKRSEYQIESQAAPNLSSKQLASPAKELLSPTRQADDLTYSIVPLDFISYQIVEETYADGTRYEGEKMLGKRHGRGNFFYKEGYKYEGNWKDDKMCGFGTLWIEDRRKVYEGEWEDNCFHGRGTMFNTDLKRVVDFDGTDFTKLKGNWLKFEGLFEKGKKHGIGSLLLANGDVFVGNFINDVVHGKGSYTSKKGATFAGLWQINKLVERY